VSDERIKEHLHEPEHRPASGTGIECCECGATRRVEKGKPVEPWHVCDLCVPLWRRKKLGI